MRWVALDARMERMIYFPVGHKIREQHQLEDPNAWFRLGMLLAWYSHQQPARMDAWMDGLTVLCAWI